MKQIIIINCLVLNGAESRVRAAQSDVLIIISAWIPNTHIIKVHSSLDHD